MLRFKGFEDRSLFGVLSCLACDRYHVGACILSPASSLLTRA